MPFVWVARTAWVIRIGLVVAPLMPVSLFEKPFGNNSRICGYMSEYFSFILSSKAAYNEGEESHHISESGLCCFNRRANPRTAMRRVLYLYP
jgi:hypothetical protein